MALGAGLRLVPLPLRAAARPRLPLGCLGCRRRRPGGGRLAARARRRPAVRRQLLGDLHLSSGSPASAIGELLRENRDTLNKIGGIADHRHGRLLRRLAPFAGRLNREWHIDSLLARAGKGGPIVAGAAFAIAWTPCIGPTLSSILAARRSTEGSALEGVLLLAVYSAGLGDPVPRRGGRASRRATVAFDAVKRHYARSRCHGRRDPDRDGDPDRDRRVLPASTSRRRTSLGSSVWICRGLTPLTVSGRQPVTVTGSDPSAAARPPRSARRSPRPPRAPPRSPRGSRRSGSGRCRWRGRRRSAARGSPPSRGARPRNGFIRTSEAGNGQLELCWSIACEIASRFFASEEEGIGTGF